MATSKPKSPAAQINPFINTVIVSEESARALKEFLLTCKNLSYQNYNIRETMQRVDREYAREMDWTSENVKAKIANAYGNANKFRNITVPVVMPQVEAAVTYQTSVFLTGVPLFGCVAQPNLMTPAKQLETIIDNQAVRGGWIDEFILGFRDAEKYNFSILETEWVREKMFGIETDVASSAANSAKLTPISWEGNVVNRWDPYNSFWDIRYSTSQVSKRGEFVGTSDMISRVELKKILNTDPAIIKKFTKAALESGTPPITIAGNSSITSFFIPQINPQILLNPSLLGQFNWLAWSGLENDSSQINYRNIYMRTKLYARIIPSDFKLEVPAKNSPQIWKFVFINDDVLIYAQPVSLIQDTFPVFMSEPKRDGLAYQTKSSAMESVDFQNVTSAMMNSVIHARRRAISDRVLYDPSRVSEAHMNSDNPSAKIPIRPAAYGKPLGEAVYAFPFKDDQSQFMMGEISQLSAMADKAVGLNPARQGQFVKGNKTLSEFEGVMNNSNGRDQMKALIWECQVFTPLKETLKNNILEKQTPATLWSRELKAQVDIDPVEMRKASIQFKMSDGLVPSEKLISGDMLGKALNVIGTNQALSSGYNIAGVFSYLMKSQDVDLVPFEKSNAQMSYEQAMGQWQGTISAMEETLQAVTKNIINPTPESILKFIGDFRKTYPPQPTPEQYGYDPKQNPISTNSEPTESVLAQTSAIIKGPTAGAEAGTTTGAAQ
jgi:hypothetical protein